MSPGEAVARASVLAARDRLPEALRIGGLTALTTLDYPGQLAAVVFCQGCPWRCGYCHNPHLQGRLAADPVGWAGLMSFLERRRGLLDAVVFSGGEPTLQTALPAALAEVRRLGFKTGLHSAGCYPGRLARVLPLLDWIGLDVKDTADHYAVLTGDPGSGLAAWQSLSLVQAAGIDYQVRITVDPVLLPQARLARLTAQLRDHGVDAPVLQAARAVASGLRDIQAAPTGV